jgi:tyrosine-protein phosphatase SIW14
MIRPMPSRRRSACLALLFTGAFLALAYAGVSNAPPPRGKSGHPGLPNFDQVSTNLYRGAQPKVDGFEELARRGIRTIVNLRSKHADDLPDGSPIREVRIPMLADKPQVDDIRVFLRTVTDTTNQPVFVHCRRGADRTGLMVASYRIVVEGWAKSKAIDEMKNGGYQFFPGYQDIIRTLEALDAPALRADLKLPPPP